MDDYRQRFSQQSYVYLDDEDQEYDPFGSEYPMLPPYDVNHHYSNNVDDDIDSFPQSPRSASYAASIAPLLPPPEYSPHPLVSQASPNSPTLSIFRYNRRTFRPGELMRRTFSTGNPSSSHNETHNSRHDASHSHHPLRPSTSNVPHHPQHHRGPPSDPNWAAYVDHELLIFGFLIFVVVLGFVVYAVVWL